MSTALSPSALASAPTPAARPGPWLAAWRRLRRRRAAMWGLGVVLMFTLMALLAP